MVNKIRSMVNKIENYRATNNLRIKQFNNKNELKNVSPQNIRSSIVSSLKKKGLVLDVIIGLDELAISVYRRIGNLSPRERPETFRRITEINYENLVKSRIDYKI